MPEFSEHSETPHSSSVPISQEVLQERAKQLAARTLHSWSKLEAAVLSSGLSWEEMVELLSYLPNFEGTREGAMQAIEGIRHFHNQLRKMGVPDSSMKRMVSKYLIKKI